MLAKLKPSIRPLPPGLAFFSPTVLIATWFGSGRIRPASGTIGTLAALPFGIVIGAIGGPAGLALAALILFFIGKAAAEAYGKKSGSSDDQAIVVDEAVGLWIAGIPAAAAPGSARSTTDPPPLPQSGARRHRHRRQGRLEQPAVG